MLAELHFQTGARSEALNAARECVKIDGDHKGCKTLCVCPPSGVLGHLISPDTWNWTTDTKS
jgi:hypothetical protein